jgi:hypothetical protein
MTLRHFSNAFVFVSGSLVVTKISTGILPPFNGSKSSAMFPPHQYEYSGGRARLARRTFLCGSDNVYGLGGEDKEGSRKFVSEEPELYRKGLYVSRDNTKSARSPARSWRMNE